MGQSHRPFFITMPWHIEKRDDKFCVIKDSDDTVEDCHMTKKKAKDHMSALYANEEKEIEGGVGLAETPANHTQGSKQTSAKAAKVTFFKNKSLDTWVWLLVVSNNILDREKEILTSDAHKEFVRIIDDGEYKELMGQDMPELWIWHVPFPIGDTVKVAYHQKGFLVAGGYGRKGEIYDRIFTVLADKERQKPGSLAASHGMPTSFIERDPTTSAYIIRYASKEFTVLPRKKAANQGTWLPAVRLKEQDMDDNFGDKRQWFVETFGEETVSDMDQFLESVARETDDAGIPKKELESMADSTEELTDETLEETVEATDEATEAPVEDTAVADVEEVKMEEEEEDSSEEDEEDSSKQDEEDEEEEEKQYVTKSEMHELIKELAVQIGGPINEIKHSLKEQGEKLDLLGADVEKVKQDDATKIAEKAATTPPLSYAAMFTSSFESAIGSEETRLDYNKDRGLYRAGPEENDDVVPGGLGVGVIDGFLKEQRSGQTLFMPGNPNNGQQV